MNDDLLLKEIKERKSVERDEHLSIIEKLKDDIDNPSRFDKIEKEFKNAVEIEEKYNLDKRTAAIEYALYLYKQNNYEKAMSYAITYLYFIDKDDIQEISFVYTFIAQCYRIQNEQEKAEMLYKKALDINYHLLKTDFEYFGFNFSCVCNNLASLYEETGNFEEAEKLYKDTLAVLERLL